MTPIAWTTQEGTLIYRCDEDGPYFERHGDGRPSQVLDTLPVGATPLVTPKTTDELWKSGMQAGIRVATATVLAATQLGVPVNQAFVADLLKNVAEAVDEVDQMLVSE